jgi:hypothetical protein
MCQAALTHLRIPDSGLAIEIGYFALGVVYFALTLGLMWNTIIKDLDKYWRLNRDIFLTLN